MYVRCSFHCFLHANWKDKVTRDANINPYQYWVSGAVELKINISAILEPANADF